MKSKDRILLFIGVDAILLLIIIEIFGNTLFGIFGICSLTLFLILDAFDFFGRYP